MVLAVPSESRSIEPTCFDLPAKPETDSDNNSSRQENRTEKLHRFKLASQGVLVIFIYGGVRMKGQIETQKMDPL